MTEQNGLNFQVSRNPHMRSELGESPFWDPANGDLWWVDIAGKKLLWRDGASGQCRAWTTPEHPGFVALSAQAGPVLGMETGIFAFDAKSGGFDRLVPFDWSGYRFNDATVDARGRLWASVITLDAEPGQGRLFRVGPGLDLIPVASGMMIPNGLAFDALTNRLFYSDSFVDAQTIWSQSLSEDPLTLQDSTVFATTTDLPGRPDGAAMDSQGNYWIAGVDGGELYVFAPDGRLTDRITTPFQFPTKISFAGPGGRRLALTSKVDARDGGFMAIAQIPADRPAGVPQPLWVTGV